ncbi:MAG TPA: helix-turn-helix domain-containing protein [Candidatus Nanoarchaeia archaeon]|nr:helix-turn-helix domain-containing protein [Candidatus Nanoarchaeia archaeon]
MRRQITIVELPLPKGHDVNFELQWLGNSLGLFGDRDKDRSCFRVFITLVKDGRRQPLSSDQIADQLDLSRGTVIHHINNLMQAGIVTHERGGYALRVERLQVLIGELQRDTEKMFENLKRISKDIDQWMGL